MFSRITLFILALSAVVSAYAETNPAPARILHVMSYHQSWEWNIEQFQGFKDGLGDLDAEYKVVALDTKRNSMPAAINEKVHQAEKLIEEWKPDLLYTNDDNAQKYLAQNYVNSSLPIVFSAVNRDPSEYGFLGADNVTGVLEYEHFVPSVNLLRSVSKDIQRIAVIIDSDPTWRGVITRMRTDIKHIPDVEITDWILVKNLKQYKQTINDLQTRVDAIALLGVFNIKDEHGKDVSYEEILKWTAEHSQLPDFAYWESRVDRGTLVAVAVSGYEQGFLAGQKARQILHDGVSPGDIKMTPSVKGQPMISLRRAKAMNLNPDVKLLLDNTVKTRYAWEEN